MKRKIFILGLILVAGTAMKTDKPAYRFFDQQGKPADYDEVVKTALKADLVFFGELHNSPICHWLELELTKDIYEAKKEDLILGAEMFESDNQLMLNEYLAGKIKGKNFEDEAKLWDNYKTDYKPLVEFALKNKIPFIATNIPRRYASLVNKSGFEGLDSLSSEAASFFPPLPIAYDPELKGYKEIMEAMGGAGGHASPNIAKAQAIKDATMAYFILKNYSPGKIFIHFNGTYHTDNYEGIIWYIRQSRPDLRILTIASVEQESLEELSGENTGLAGFILCIPESMSKSY